MKSIITPLHTTITKVVCHFGYLQEAAYYPDMLQNTVHSLCTQKRYQLCQFLPALFPSLISSSYWKHGFSPPTLRGKCWVGGSFRIRNKLGKICSSMIHSDRKTVRLQDKLTDWRLRKPLGMRVVEIRRNVDLAKKNYISPADVQNANSVQKFSMKEKESQHFPIFFCRLLVQNAD